MVAEIDTRRVDRILRNLIYNAIDHADGKPIELELAADEEVLAITVTDHGVGLRPGEAGLVFNRFWRADPSRQRQTGGTGLGLAISLEDARLHGGWLQASGAPGEGARFRLTLPRQPRRADHPVAAAAADRARIDRPSVRPVRAVAVDDRVMPVEGVRMMVEDGTLKPAPSDDDLHPASVPEAGATATLSSTDQVPTRPGGSPARNELPRPTGAAVSSAHGWIDRERAMTTAAVGDTRSAADAGRSRSR